jgi:hypothetical protein
MDKELIKLTSNLPDNINTIICEYLGPDLYGSIIKKEIYKFIDQEKFEKQLKMCNIDPVTNKEIYEVVKRHLEQSTFLKLMIHFNNSLINEFHSKCDFLRKTNKYRIPKNMSKYYRCLFLCSRYTSSIDDINFIPIRDSDTLYTFECKRTMVMTRGHPKVKIPEIYYRLEHGFLVNNFQEKIPKFLSPGKYFTVIDKWYIRNVVYWYIYRCSFFDDSKNNKCVKKCMAKYNKLLPLVENIY